MMSKNANIAVQILPMVARHRMYEVIDKAIEVIRGSGMKYEVCPFETVIEGPYEEVMDLIGSMRDACYEAGCEELIINMKMQLSRQEDVKIEDKINKYR